MMYGILDLFLVNNLFPNSKRVNINSVRGAVLTRVKCNIVFHEEVFLRCGNFLPWHYVLRCLLEFIYEIYLNLYIFISTCIIYFKLALYSTVYKILSCKKANRTCISQKYKSMQHINDIASYSHVKSDGFDVRRRRKDLLLWFGPFLLKAVNHLNVNTLCVDTTNNNR